VPEPVTSDPVTEGINLRSTLAQKEVNKFAWSPDGQLLAAPSSNKQISIWDPYSSGPIATLKGHTHLVRAVAWSPDSKILASASDDHSIRLWQMPTGEPLATLEGHTKVVLTIAWSKDGKFIASGSYDDAVKVWEVGTRSIIASCQTGWVYAADWSYDGTLFFGGLSGNIYSFDLKSQKLVRAFVGHSEPIYALQLSPHGDYLSSGSSDKTVRIWDVAKKQQTNVLEGCTGTVGEVCFSSDSRLLASTCRDGTIRIWRTDRWELVADIEANGSLFSGLAFHPTKPILATVAPSSKDICLWNIDAKVLLTTEPASQSVRYTNAKVVLIGDTGVGKTGLGLVLTHQEFCPTESTHGRHIWTFAEQNIELPKDRTETRETLLWDLAGQPGYRLIHQMHLNEVSVALVVFDSRSETDPFSGVRHWDRALRQASLLQGESALPIGKLLVAARCDRGGIGVSQERINNLLKEMEFDAYFETSAKEGWGVNELIGAINKAISWDKMPRVSSTELFHGIKKFLLNEKEAGHLLSTVNDLFHSFRNAGEIPPKTKDLRAQFDTCVGLVEASGLIKRLSFGNLVLLQPEMLDAYASSMVNAAKDEPHELGTISEDDARAGRFRMPEDERIPNKESESLLLIATVEHMIRHEIALREVSDDGTLLVFPSQFRREHPDFPEPRGKAAIFTFEGPILSVYATLAVRLSHSRIFKRKEMWKNAATFSGLLNGTCGIFLRETKEGSGELTLFYDAAATEETRFQFEEYVSSHLLRRALPETVNKRRVFTCASCREAVTDGQVLKRLELGFTSMSCPVCATNIELREEMRPVIAESSLVTEIDRAANEQREFDAGLISAAGEMHTTPFREWVGAAAATLAIVFTDIVSSTTIGNELGDEAMNKIRRDHFQQVRHQLRYYNGYEIKTIGDSFMMAFRTAVEALDFTLSVFSRTGSNRIKIKAGIHVGPVRIEEDDAFGTMVNLASRVVGKAEGPEIWTSDSVKHDIDLEKARRHANLTWIEHADCELRGFPARRTLWSVVPQL
jgi:small GTP-binding protein